MAQPQQTAGSRNIYRYRVVLNEPAGQDLIRMVIEAPALAAALTPGQFMNFEVPGNAAHILRVPLSFSAASADAGTIEVVYALVGEGTRALAQLAAGDTSTAIGPLGNGWKLPQDPTKSALLIAGGVGAPPIIAAARMFAQAGVSCEVIIGAQTAAKLWVAPELAELAGCHVHIATDDGSRGYHGFTTTCAKELFFSCNAPADKPIGSVLTCGPTPMMAQVAKLAAAHNLPCQASLEALMSCGFGACNTCNVPLVTGGYASCCSDGPVMDAHAVRWSK